MAKPLINLFARTEALSKLGEQSPFFRPTQKPKLTEEQQKLREELVGVQQQGTSIFDILNRHTPLPEPVPELQPAADLTQAQEQFPTVSGIGTSELPPATPEDVVNDVIKGDKSIDTIDVSNLDFGEPIPLPRTDGAM